MFQCVTRRRKSTHLMPLLGDGSSSLLCFVPPSHRNISEGWIWFYYKKHTTICSFQKAFSRLIPRSQHSFPFRMCPGNVRMGHVIVNSFVELAPPVRTKLHCNVRSVCATNLYSGRRFNSAELTY